MKFSIITFRSVTPAQRAERVLQQEGFSCNVRRTPRWMEEQGCGYGVRLHYQDLHRAVDVLEQKQIPYKKLYMLRDNGTAEELVL